MPLHIMLMKAYREFVFMLNGIRARILEIKKLSPTETVSQEVLEGIT